MLAEAVHDARWVWHDAERRRVMVWPGVYDGDRRSDLVSIVHEVTGERLGSWPCDGDSLDAQRVTMERIAQGF